MENWVIGIATGLIVFVVTAPIGFFVGRTFERRWNPAIWVLENVGTIIDPTDVTMPRVTSWDITRVAKARAFEPELYRENGPHPRRTDVTRNGSAARDLLRGQTGNWMLDHEPAGSYTLVWVEKGRRREAVFKIISHTASITIRKSESRPHSHPLRLE